MGTACLAGALVAGVVPGPTPSRRPASACRAGVPGWRPGAISFTLPSALCGEGQEIGPGSQFTYWVVVWNSADLSFETPHDFTMIG